VYCHADKRDAETAKGLTLEEARRIAGNIAKLPIYLRDSDQLNRSDTPSNSHEEVTK
jgi:hypothetical protein